MQTTEKIPDAVYQEAAINDAKALLATTHYECNLDVTGKRPYCSDHEVYLND